LQLWVTVDRFVNAPLHDDDDDDDVISSSFFLNPFVCGIVQRQNVIRFAMISGYFLGQGFVRTDVRIARVSEMD
jgi:hypothetical protein